MAANDIRPSFTAITAVGVTATQNSALIARPNKQLSNMVVIFDVTDVPGAAVDLNVGLVGIRPDGSEILLSEFATAVTAVGTQIIGIHEGLVAVVAPMLTWQVVLPQQFKLRVTHGNAETVSYTLEVLQ